MKIACNLYYLTFKVGSGLTVSALFSTWFRVIWLADGWLVVIYGAYQGNYARRLWLVYITLLLILELPLFGVIFKLLGVIEVLVGVVLCCELSNLVTWMKGGCY